MRYFVFVLSLVSLTLIFSCKTSKNAAMVNPANDTIITKGDTIKIVKNENISTGYMWFWEITEGKNHIKFLYDESKSNVPDSLIQKGYVGGGSTKTFYFLAKSKGKVAIKFEYKRANGKPEETDLITFEIK